MLQALSTSVALAQPSPVADAAPAPPVEQARKDEAKNHFDVGLAHLDRSEWSAALAEFLRSRELFPTRAGTKNADTRDEHILPSNGTTFSRSPSI